MNNEARDQSMGLSETEERRVRVAFDTSAISPDFKAHAHRGIGRYVRELQNFFRGFSQGKSNSVDVKYFDFISLKSGYADALINKFPVGKQTLRQQIVYPFSLARASKGCDFIHFPAQMDAPAWGRRRYVLTVHDLIPLICADLYRAVSPNWKFAFGRWLELRAIKGASHIIAISESTADDLVRVLSIPREKISVTHLGVDQKFLSVARLPPTQEEDLRVRLNIPSGCPIVLYVGGIDPRKNYVGLLETAKRVVERVVAEKQPTPCFVIAGNIESDREYPKLQALVKSLKLDATVICTGFVSEKDLLSLYGISTLLFFPSLYEGFGLTPLEALAAGLPVVSSKTSAMPEVLGNEAVLVSPLDFNECAEALFSLLKNPERRMEMSIRGRERAKLFSWEKTGLATLKVYEALERKN